MKTGMIHTDSPQAAHGQNHLTGQPNVWADYNRNRSSNQSDRRGNSERQHEPCTVKGGKVLKLIKPFFKYTKEKIQRSENEVEIEDGKAKSKGGKIIVT